MTRTIGSRVGTNSPTDLFNLMSEHLKIARKGGSLTLQRRLLSCVMSEVRHLCTLPSVLWFITLEL